MTQETQPQTISGVFAYAKIQEPAFKYQSTTEKEFSIAFIVTLKCSANSLLDSFSSKTKRLNVSSLSSVQNVLFFFHFVFSPNSFRRFRTAENFRSSNFPISTSECPCLTYSINCDSSSSPQTRRRLSVFLKSLALIRTSSHGLPKTSAITRYFSPSALMRVSVSISSLVQYRRFFKT